MGFSLNNLSNSLLKMGTSFLQMGTFYSASKAINSGCGGSVFGGCYGGGMYGGSICGGSVFGYGGGYGYDNPIETQYMMGQAYGQGYALAQQMSMLNAAGGMGSYAMMPGMMPGMLPGTQNTTTAVQKTNNPAADKVDQNQDTSLAEKFEENIKDQKDTRFVLSGWENLNDDERDIAHMDASDGFGKSYIMHMDKTAGNSDGEITLDEFKAYNIKTDLGADATDEMKTRANKNSEIAFNKLDQNGDGKLDWKEMSSMFTVYDSVLDGKYDGKITKAEVDAGNKLLLNQNDTRIDQKLRQAYNELYPPQDE